MASGASSLHCRPKAVGQPLKIDERFYIVLGRPAADTAAITGAASRRKGDFPYIRVAAWRR